jgi:serine/threonine protein kinase
MMGTLDSTEMIGGDGRSIDGGELIGQGTYGCVYYPGIKCPGKKGDYKKYVTKLEVVDRSFKNELEISKIIRQIKNYKKFFVPIIKTCPIKLSTLSETDIRPDKCEVLNKNSGREFILIYMRYIKGKDLFDFLNDIKSNISLDFNTISQKLLYYYKYLLEGLGLFLTKDIVHMDLKNDNVMISDSNKKLGRPLIIDYGLSINMKSVHEILKGHNLDGDDSLSKLRKIFIAYAPEVDYWPLEIQIITYILYKNNFGEEKFLNKENIKIVIDDIMRENKIYRIFSSKDKILFKSQGMEFLNDFIGKLNLDVIRELVMYYKSWDNFALSIMYLRIFNTIGDKLKEQDENVKKLKSIERVLIKNISTDPRLRLSILKTQGEVFGEKKK